VIDFKHGQATGIRASVGVRVGCNRTIFSLVHLRLDTRSMYLIRQPIVILARNATGSKSGL